MASKNELIEIRMKLLGAKEVAEGTGVAKKGIKGVGEATRATAGHSSKAAKANSVLTRSYGALGRAAKYGIGILGVTGVFALESAIHNTQELSKTTVGLARNFRLSTQEASRYAAVAYGRGIATTALNMSFTKLSKSFVEANRKGGTARTALNQLGITQAQTAKGSKDFGYALELVAKQFGKAKGGPERQAAAMSLLGKGYSTVLPLFAQGTKGLKEQLAWADKYGVTLNGKTNSSLMEMVNAQRESKVAMLGLQLALTKALMPAIKGGEEQLQQFIAVLNDPKLSSTQKITHIQAMFENLETKLIEIIAQALPKVAEGGGKLGIALAGAVWEGFKNSNLVGKLVIGAWLFKFLGGFSAIANAGSKVGGKLAVALGTKFFETVAPYFAAEAGVEGLGSALGSQMTGLKTLFSTRGKILGTAMGTAAAGALAAEVVIGVEEQLHHKLFDILELINPQATGVSSQEEEATYLSGLGYTGIKFKNPHAITALDPEGHHVTVKQHGKDWALPGSNGGGKHPQHSSAGKGNATKPRRNFSELWTPHFHFEVDGKEIAHVVARHANRAAARA